LHSTTASRKTHPGSGLQRHPGGAAVRPRAGGGPGEL